MNTARHRRRRPRPRPLPAPSYRVYVFGSGAGAALGVDEGGARRKISLHPVPLLASSSSTSKRSRPRLDLDNLNVEQVAAGDRVSSFLTKEGECYSWGKIGRDTECPEPSRIDCGPNQIQKIRHGSTHTVALTSSGQALVWTNNSSRSRVMPRRIPVTATGTAFRDAGCSDQSALLLSQDGQSIYQYSFSSTAGATVSPAGNAMRRGQKKQSSLRQVPLPLSVQVANLDCGPNHSALVSTAGHLYTFGWGHHGRLGLGDEEPRSNPQLVKTLAKDNIPIGSVSCGSAHTCALTTMDEGGRVYAFGSNVYGQVGSTAFDRYLYPHEVLIDGQVSAVACGFGHTAAVTFEGELYCCGMNEEGQLGLSAEGQCIDVPTRVDSFPEGQYVVKVACGHLHTICTISDLTPAEIEEYGRQNEQLENATAVISRFARFALLRIRLRKFARQRIADAEEHGSGDESDDDGDSSRSESNISVDSAGFMAGNSEDDTATVSDAPVTERMPLTDAADEAIRRHQEMTAMSAEDYACHLVRAEEKATMEELQRQEEMELMMAEEEASRILRNVEKRTSAEARQSKTRRKIIDRNARVNESIQREVNRLKAARERQREHANAKMRLPPVNRRRKQTDTGATLANKPSNRISKNSGSITCRRNKRMPKKADAKITQALLENRRMRSEKQHKVNQEQQQKREEDMKKSRRANIQRQLSAKRERERLERERKRRINRNIEELKERLGFATGTVAAQTATKRRNERKGQRFHFKTAGQWTAQLQQK